MLIDWAVSTQRSGNYRAVVVAKLVEKLQNEIRSEVKKILISSIMKEKEINVREYRRAIKKGQSRETGNIGLCTKKNKTKTQYNMWWIPLCANKQK